jgi:hypothetical protein
MPRKGEELVHTDASCTAKTRDGDLCKNAPMMAQGTCRMHGGSTQASRAKAQERILAAADPAAAKLVQLIQDKRVPHNVQLAAARDLLDRAGLASAQEITLKIPAFLQGIEGILVDIESDDVVDAELVDEDDPLEIRQGSDATSTSPTQRRRKRVR